MPTVIVVADSEAVETRASGHDRRAFNLKERVTSLDVSDPHVASQLIERIGWALADAEEAERLRTPAAVTVRDRRPRPRRAR